MAKHKRRKHGSKTSHMLIRKHLREAGAFFSSAAGKKAIAEFCKEVK